MDRIQLFQEELIPEAEAWEKDGIFNTEEVKVIIQKRTDHEYKISAGAADKTDFLRFIKFESNLNQLVKTRYSKLKLPTPEWNSYSKNRINGIFNRAQVRWKEDPNLYLLHIDYCKKAQITSSIKSAFTLALQFLPSHVEFWSMAAMWEWEEHRNFTVARALMQMGLRVNITSAQLWREYFYLELIIWREHVALLRKSLSAPLFNESGDSINLSQLTSGIEQQAGTELLAELVSSQQQLSPFLLGTAPHIVYTGALKAIGKDDLTFRIALYEIVRKFLMAIKIQKIILGDLVADFPQHPTVIALRADICIRGKPRIVENYIKAFDVFELAIKEHPSERLWVCYIQFILTKVYQIEVANHALVDYMTNKLVLVVQTISKAEAVVVGQVSVFCVPALLSIGFVGEAYTLACNATTVAPHDWCCWKTRMELEVKLGKPHEDILVHFEEAVKASSPPHVNLWSMYIQWLVMADSGLAVLNSDVVDEALKIKKDNKAITNVAIRCLKSVFSILKAEEYGVLKSQLLDMIIFRCGIHTAHLFIQQSLMAPPNSLNYYKHCIIVEKAQPLISNNAPPSPLLQSVYERAVQEYGSETSCEDVWLGYIQLETQWLRMDRAADIYWRAKNTLHTPNSFVSKFEGIK